MPKSEIPSTPSRPSKPAAAPVPKGKAMKPAKGALATGKMKTPSGRGKTYR